MTESCLGGVVIPPSGGYANHPLIVIEKSLEISDVLILARYGTGRNKSKGGEV